MSTGALVWAVEGDQEPLVRPLYGIGNELGHVGTYAFLAGVLALGVAACLRHGPTTLYGSVLLLASAVSLLDSHIYWPRGGVTMLGIAAGFALLVWAVDRRPRTPAAASWHGDAPKAAGAGGGRLSRAGPKPGGWRVAESGQRTRRAHG
ncbi:MULTISPECIES: hypothetical protein [unclassified Nocardiopsis]|uniref:hypothetical protein n=1 Tax=unclassified Nocardiopsis TaxID=2649073 RepID=UPI0018FF01AC|nr:hypothetical protein [Nocardiopsis sp. TSRI0078]